MDVVIFLLIYPNVFFLYFLFNITPFHFSVSLSLAKLFFSGSGMKERTNSAIDFEPCMLSDDSITKIILIKSIPTLLNIRDLKG